MHYLKFVLVALVAHITGCGGSVFVDVADERPACDDSSQCPGDQVCIGGQCSVQSQTCAPLMPEGECPSGQTCVTGVCYDDGRAPDACSEVHPNGACEGDAACVDGQCQPIGDDACGPDNPDGLCRGGHVCIQGTCYPDDGTECSEDNPDGYCGPGQRCTSLGTCVTDPGSCGPFVPDGTCPSWQTCVQGDCVGPIPPDACSPDNPTGRCPQDEVCVGGTCTPFTETNACSPEHPNGLCPAGSACENGTCVAIDSDNGCSGDIPDGLCPGGATCQDGACVQTGCGDGGWQCDPGQWCVDGACVAAPCDAAHPYGTCDDPTLVCQAGACLPPTCSPEYPDGVCPEGLVCRDGSCGPPDCSPEHPNGVCPEGQVCGNGECVEGPCSPTNLDGVCTTRTETCHPEGGCNYSVLDSCCDSDLAGATGCEQGTCAPTPCSAEAPHGQCPYNQYCDAGTCVDAPCSPFFSDGYCEDTEKECIWGTCRKTDCLSQPPDYCGDKVCDAETDTCVTPPCSAENPNGTCPSGETCCDQALRDDGVCGTVGQCFAPPCMPEFPGGDCPEGQLCVGGECTRPPCSETYPNGTCGPNYTCDGGTCVRAPCGLDAPQGTCPSGEICYANSCTEYACSDTFPDGPCPVGTICVEDTHTCQEPACSPEYPGGACGSGEICSGGTCVPQPCSTTFPSGACQDGFDCVSGVCKPAECSSEVPDGACTGADAGKVCVDGECTVYECSADFPDGPCPAGELCDDTQSPPTCTVPDCSPPYPGGACPDPQVCVGGSCVLPACSTEVTNGACPDNQICCDATLESERGCTVGTCVLADCSPSNPEGRCTGGDICCDQDLVDAGYCDSSGNCCGSVGECVATVCSDAFPAGECTGPDAGKICVGGSCVSPCSSANRDGWCASGFACVEGACSFACNNDADCDDILDSDEGLGAGVDTDGDGSPDGVDRDADGDGVPDAVEAGDLDPATPPQDSDNDGEADFRDLDADGDHIADSFEVGPAPGTPTDTDNDGTADLWDRDSDGDGIDDACEATDAGGLCANSTLLTGGGVYDSDGDGKKDFRDTDSDDDGISDAIESRTKPDDSSTAVTAGVDHDADGTPDYRDADADGDGVADADEDSDGDGEVDCQVDGSGNPVPDERADPACGATIPWSETPFAPGYAYDYNPGCQNTGQKCLLAESSRVHPDSDGDGIADGQDGVFLVCSTENLKPINLFYSQPADYALALEQNFSRTAKIFRSGTDVGLRFDGDPNDGFVNGSDDVSGFLLARPPSSGAIATTHSDPERALIEKALAQEQADRAALEGASGVDSAALVINRNFTTFDGYGAVVSRYRITTSSSTSLWDLRAALVEALDGSGSLSGLGSGGGPTSTDFTLLTETLYRYDDGASDGRVIVVGALVPTDRFAYRARCDSYLVGSEAEDFDSRSSIDGSHDWTQQTSVSGYQGSGYMEATPNSGTNCNGDVSSCGAALTYQLDVPADGTYYAHFRINAGNGSDDSLNWGVDGTHMEQLHTEPDNDTWAWDTGNVAVNLAAGTHTLNVWMREDGQKLDQVVLSPNSTPPSSFDPNSSACGEGCVDTGGSCEPDPAYQIPLFFADNITNGSAVAQYGDDLEALCQSLVQDYSPLDFLWVIDDSGSMSEEIRQVQTSAELFFGIMNNTEADYRVAQTTTYEDRGDWEPTSSFSDYSGDESNRRNGALQGGFTGAVAGQVNTSLPDRAVTYDCADGCDNGESDCCSLCGSGQVEDPACYFASKLPDAAQRGSEFGLMMGEWAMYRHGAGTRCAAAGSAGGCDALGGCVWTGSECISGHCALPDCGSATNQSACSELAGCQWDSGNGVCVLGVEGDPAEFSVRDECNGHDPDEAPAGLDNAEGELEPAACEWNPVANGGAGACWPSVGTPCTAETTQADCAAQGPRCVWDSDNSLCLPNPVANGVLCSATTQSACESQGGGWCEWDSSGYCRPPLQYSFRPDASKVAVMLSDEETCYLKDSDYNASCPFNMDAHFDYDHPIRLAREKSFLDFYRSRDFMVFGIVGDKADRSQSPSSSNGGCSNAMPGDGYIKVAEGTGGGWGSICASDLYPTIESIVISSVARASPYVLEGFIDGQAVQPISSTIKVAVEVCDVPSEYPDCASGTHMEVVPRSRTNGFDYDPIYNTLVLYGDARPVRHGDIVASYRYWVDNDQPPAGNPTCPCPETAGPDCDCPAGLACGIEDGTDLCAPNGDRAACESTPGCVWNTADGGFCTASGLCEPDPTCGGGCGAGEVCDPDSGLCVCDTGCGSGCGPGQSCISDTSDPDCGTCACDTTCGGGCPAGQTCISDTSDPQCGQCVCDTTCGGGCETGYTCNTDTSSPTCGFCEPPQCGDCPAGTTCDPDTGLCVCDTSCGGGCPQGTVCDSDTDSASCGQCVCDTTCGGSCPTGTICNSDPTSSTCGLCEVDPTCGVPNGECNVDCSAGTDSASCSSLDGCRWAEWLNDGSGGCVPITCKDCNPSAGVCQVDPTCCDSCGPTESCNPNTGQCECDVNCGGGCPPGLTCDSDPGSSTCGLCRCDTTCGGAACPEGLVCDDNSACAPLSNESDCSAAPDCAWDVVAEQCVSIFCGRCVPDPTCGGGCPDGEACNPTTGLCEPECPECPQGTLCDPLTGECICDQTCGGSCPQGSFCQSDPAQESCGTCVCDTTCGGACPEGQICDDGSACAGLDAAACRDDDRCAYDETRDTCFSPSCGLCVVDPTCGGDCPPGEVCDPLTGLCVTDPNCGGCPSGFYCDTLTGSCKPEGG